MTNSATVHQVAARLMRHPAVPYREHAVRVELERLCAEESLECAADRFGNLFVRVWGRVAARPLVLAAHMDHPGFGISLYERLVGRLPARLQRLLRTARARLRDRD